jgi:hypothetical protein
MPVWGYFVLGFIILALVLLTARRNQVAYRESPLDYGTDFRAVLESSAPAVEELQQAIAEATQTGDPQVLSRAASSARSRIHANISNLDRLGFPDSASEAERELLIDLRLKLRQAMENYEWAARIAETTDLLDNQGLRRAFESLVASGDQLCFDSRLQLLALGPAAAGG